MKSYTCVLIFLILTIIPSVAQSLNHESLKHAKDCIVKIKLSNGSSGSGFLVSTGGTVMTCWHVVQSAALDLTGSTTIVMEMLDGEASEMTVHKKILSDTSVLRNAIGTDYCILVPKQSLKKKTPFLALGSFNDVLEGDVIFTVGYPLKIEEPFVSQGIVSTKFEQTKPMFRSQRGTINGRDTVVMLPVKSVERQVAWLDITLNRGNSGGPIIKPGRKPKFDRVVGIATFILNPFAEVADKLVVLTSDPGGSNIEFGGVSQKGVNRLLGEVARNNSLGISGCISINEAKTLLEN